MLVAMCPPSQTFAQVQQERSTRRMECVMYSTCHQPPWQRLPFGSSLYPRVAMLVSVPSCAVRRHPPCRHAGTRLNL